MVVAAFVFCEGAKTLENRYQVMPPLSEEEYAALKADIAENGVLLPVVVDENGVMIDGYNRLRAVEELRAEGHDVADPPKTVRADLETEQQKRDEARRLNSLRRNLNRAQKRDVIATKLQETPAWANHRVAALLGVSSVTVDRVRLELEAASQIKKLDKLEGRDGKLYPRQYTNSFEQQVRYAEERKRHEIRRGLLKPFGMDRADADIAEELDVRESEVSEQRADLREHGPEERDFVAYPGSPEEGQARRLYLQRRAEARERGELRHEDAKAALKWMDHLYHALHLTNENPNRRVTPEDVAKAYLDRETLGGYDDRMKRRLRNDLVQFDALAEWMEPFASSARSEVEVWLKTEEEMVEQRKETEEINRLNQNWKDSGGYVEEDE